MGTNPVIKKVECTIERILRGRAGKMIIFKWEEDGLEKEIKSFPDDTFLYIHESKKEGILHIYKSGRIDLSVEDRNGFKIFYEGINRNPDVYIEGKDKYVLQEFKFSNNEHTKIVNEILNENSIPLERSDTYIRTKIKFKVYHEIIEKITELIEDQKIECKFTEKPDFLYYSPIIKNQKEEDDE